MAIAEASLKLKTIEQETKEAAEDIKGINEKQDNMGVEVPMAIFRSADSRNWSPISNSAKIL